MNHISGKTLERLHKIRVDAIYGKKKHFNAADRKRVYQTYASVTIILINVILGSALFLYIKETIPDVMRWAGGLLALGAALVAALQTYFSWPKVVQGHCKAGGQYLFLAKQCSNISAQYSDGIISDQQLGDHLEKLTAELSNIDEVANIYPTNKFDYKVAQGGIKNGEEHYADDELKAGD